MPPPPSPYDHTRQVAQILLKSAAILDLPAIRNAVTTAKMTLPDDVTREAVDSEKLVKELEANFSVWIGVETSLVDNTNHEAWLPEAKATINWAYWKRYQRFLEEEKSWSSSTVRTLDRLVDSVLEKLEAPGRSGNWDRRGLVAGHVQSGKTSHFTGLICKAVDAGYKLVIVLAGTHDSLRSQTQERLDEGFLGYDSQNTAAGGPRKVIGVGALDPGCPPVNTITTSADNGDFRKSVAQNFHIAPDTRLLFVIKKNTTVLKHLLGWIENYAQHTDASTGRKFNKDVPLLVIDDEADNASIDTRPDALDEEGNPDAEHDPAKTNGLIRRLLGFFSRSAYVGYTATPFANIYIPDNAATDAFGDDLFPRSFIVNLPAPSNYMGPVQVFGLAGGGDTDRLPLVTKVDDFLDTSLPAARKDRPEDWEKGAGWMPPKHGMEHKPLVKGRDELPGSLKEAIRAFILARAGRIARGQLTEHNSMLIHVSRLTPVQGLVVQQVSAELSALQDEIDLWNGTKEIPEVKEFARIWAARTQPAIDAMAGPDLIPLTWAHVRPALKAATAGIVVRETNGSAGDTLEYKEAKATGLNVIAVGGDKLARGLTLEGLSVSYFLRATKLYDTLMQMGRWFGYRPGYADLCRLYTSPDLVSWYVHIARANEELREMFDDMSRRKLTPQAYGLRVQAHPDGLLITGSGKMRYATKVRLSFDGSISETVVYSLSQTSNNLKRAEAMVAKLGPSTPSAEAGSSRVWKDVPVATVLEFLAEVQVPEHGPHKARPSLLTEFIKKHNGTKTKELTRWTIGLVSNTDAPTAERISLGSETGVGMVTRTIDSSDGEGFSIGRLVNPSDESLGVDAKTKAAALEITRKNYKKDYGRGRYRQKESEATPESIKIPSGTALRGMRSKEEGLLLLYLVKPVTKSKVSGKTVEAVLPGVAVPVLGFALSFPSETTKATVDYVVNPVYWDQEYANQ